MFVGVSDELVLYPVAPRHAGEAAKVATPESLRGHGCLQARLSSSPLTLRLHAKFRRFQLQAKRIQERVEDTQMPVDNKEAEDVLQQYTCGVADELRRARDELRRGKWDIDPAVHADHDVLCVNLAVWELMHELVVTSAPSPAGILHWYNRHYLEEEIAEWWQKASQQADDPTALQADSEFWQPLCRLALSDCREEVLGLLQRAAAAADTQVDVQVSQLCEFLRRIPSLQQMLQAGASKVEYQQAMAEIQSRARQLMARTPHEHPTKRLLQIYAGSPQAAFDAGEDVAKEHGRNWIEDLVYSYAWVFPELRKTELADLLHDVARRRTDETIDDIDRVLFTVFALDVPGLLQLLVALPDRFPTAFVTHLLDVLYFAGRVPLVVEAEGQQFVPPRDWHLMQYAQELCRGPRSHKRIAIDYLRAGGSEAVVKFLELVADDYCATAATEEEMHEAMVVLADLGLAAKIGVKQCRRRAQTLRSGGDVAGCLRWACQAEQYASPAQGYFVSELLDSLAESPKELEELLTALTPSSLDEPLERYPPEFLLASLAPSGEPLRALAPSGRLYFFVQYARCRALRRKRPTSEYAPMLVKLLSDGLVAPGMARQVIEDDLMSALKEESPGLTVDQALLLMRYVQGVSNDPFQRVQLSINEDFHRAMGDCLSRAILAG